jgi:hypothetical protein
MRKILKLKSTVNPYQMLVEYSENNVQESCLAANYLSVFFQFPVFLFPAKPKDFFFDGL